MMNLALAAEGASAVETAFQTAITQVQTDVTGMINVALPVGLAIAGVIIAIRIGWRFFKSVAK